MTMITMIILYHWICYLTNKFTVEVEYEQKLPFFNILVRRTDSNQLQIRVYRKPTNKSALFHILSFHDIKIKSVLSEKSPINIMERL